MIGDAAGKFSGDARDLEHVGEEAAQLPGPGCQRLGARAPGGVVEEERGIFGADLVGAGAGGGHHSIVALELGDDLFRQRQRGNAVVGIEGRLAAAGLPFWDDDLAAGGFEQAQRCETDARAHQVNEAGDEERDFHQFAL